jgi:hypothetical protein
VGDETACELDTSLAWEPKDANCACPCHDEINLALLSNWVSMAFENSLTQF